MIKRSMTAGLVLATFALAGAAAEREEAWVLRQVREIKDSDNEAWRRIPWTASLLDARQASQKEYRPVFLFTHDGNIDTGRC
jgi:hypothetical protein